MRPSRLLLAPLLVSAWVLGLGGISFYTPAMINIQHSLGIPSTLVKLTISSFIFGKAISMIAIAPFADHFSRKKLLVFGLLLFTGGSIICLLAPDINTLLTGRFIEGLGVSICILMGRAIVNDQFPPNIAANLFSIIFIGNAIAITLMPVLSGYVTHYLSWRYIFLILSIYGSGVILLIFYLLPQNPLRTSSVHYLREFFHNSRVILTNHSFIGFMLSLSLIDTGEKILTTMAPFVFIEKFGLSQIAFGYLQGSLWCAHLLGLAICGYIVLRRPLDQMIGTGVIICLLAAVCMIVAVTNSHAPALLMTIGMFIFMLSTGFIVPTSLVGIASPFPKMIGLATALAMAIEFFLGAFLTAVISHIKNHDFAVLLTTALVVGVSILLCWLFLIRQRCSHMP